MQALCRAELQPQDPGVYLGSRCHRTEPIGVGPQALQVVVRPGLGIEEVDHDVTEVEEHPFAVLLALASQRLAIERAQRLLDLVGQGEYVTSRRPGCDHEDVRDDQQPIDIEEGNVDALLVGDGSASG